MNKTIKNFINSNDKNKYEEAKKSLSEIYIHRKKLKDMEVVRSNKLISPDYCEWIVGSIIGATRPQKTNEQGYDLIKNNQKYEVKSRQVDNIHQYTVFHLKKESIQLGIDLICVLIKPNYEILGIFHVKHKDLTKIMVEENKEIPVSALGRLNLIWNKKRKINYEENNRINWLFKYDDTQTNS